MIPVFDPVIGEEEIAAVVEALRRNEISGTFGKALTDFEEKFAAYVGCRYGVATSSGTTALHLAVAAAGIGDGDEVLLSSSTNIATALAVIHNGAVPVPVDSEAETWNLDLDLVEGLITPRTKAILPVHLYGHPVDMDRLLAIARKHDLMVIEDCAESHGATCRGRMTGSFGAMSCFSFYANKIITTGEGGMVCTSDAGLSERLRLLRNLAFEQPRFLHREAGYNFRMTGMQAAMGLAQLGRIDQIIEGKRHVAAAYNKALADVPELQLPTEREWARNVYWMYAVVLRRDVPVSRDELMAALHADGVDTRTFFCPMNLQPCLWERPGFRRLPNPVAEMLWERGFYLPSTPTLDAGTIAAIAGKIRGALARGRVAAR